jgi:hypothetical protein
MTYVKNLLIPVNSFTHYFSQMVFNIILPTMMSSHRTTCILSSYEQLVPPILSSFTFRIRPSVLFPIRINMKLWFLQTVGSTPRTVDQPCGKRATYTQYNTNTEKIRRDITASSGIRIHDQSDWGGKGISCFRPLGHCDQLRQSHPPSFHYFDYVWWRV